MCTVDYPQLHNKKWNPVMCNQMGGNAGHHVEWKIPEAQRQISHILPYICELKFLKSKIIQYVHSIDY